MFLFAIARRAALLLASGAVATLVVSAAPVPAANPDAITMINSPKTAPGPRQQAWSLATADTRLTVGVTTTGQLCLYELRHPQADWNWIAAPTTHPLPAVPWKFAGGTQTQDQVVLRFVCAEPALELESVWWAPAGPGPVRHALSIHNRGAQPVSLGEVPTLDLELARPAGPVLALWSFHTSGNTPDPTGVYRHELVPGFSRELRMHPNAVNAKLIEPQSFVPYAVFDAASQQGVYVGIEWSYCRILTSAGEQRVSVRGGEYPNFKITLAPGESFAVPPGFVGVYQGDVSDAGNRLRRYLWNHSVPEVLRRDPGYPKVQWNAFGATGTAPGSWQCTETKYYPLIDDIAPLGFEEVMIDVGWWRGGEPTPDPERWPAGMAKAAEYAHRAGLRFGLYWNRGESMSTAAGRDRRMAHIRRLYQEHKADMWRSDSTGGPVVGASYEEVRGFYAMLDQLYRELPNFQWENCVCGGRLKDFGAMKRCIKIFLTDTYSETNVRQSFYDASFIYPPAQLMGCVGSSKGNFRPQGPAGLKFAFRSTSLGAPEWFLDAPGGRNGSAAWTDEEKQAVRESVALYKQRIRPLVRGADLYQILPRPNGRDWDGIQYHDPATQQGVIYLFKPGTGPDSITLKLRGVESARRYRVSFADGSNPTIERTGAELRQGLVVTLAGKGVSELVFIEPA